MMMGIRGASIPFAVRAISRCGRCRSNAQPKCRIQHDEILFSSPSSFKIHANSRRIIYAANRLSFPVIFRMYIICFLLYNIAEK